MRSIILVIIGAAFLCLGAAHCGHPMPIMNVTFWPGDPDNDQIVDKQGGRVISCRDPAFNDYACLSYEDIQEIYVTMQGCKDWGNTPVAKASKVLQKYSYLTRR